MLQLNLRPKLTHELIRTDVGQSRMYLGDYQLMIKRDKNAARKEYEVCLAIFLEQCKDDPDNLDLRQRLGATYYRLGIVAEKPETAKEMHEKSLHYREALAKIDPLDMPAQVEYLLSLARLGRLDDTDRLAQRILKQAAMDPQSLFQTACGYAICARTGGPMADEYRKQTYVVIERLLKAGWKDSVGIQTDPDFEFIRDDARFKELTQPKK
jgi:tetratricopeptide (TPR) repeat protein